MLAWSETGSEALVPQVTDCVYPRSKGKFVTRLQQAPTSVPLRQPRFCKRYRSWHGRTGSQERPHAASRVDFMSSVNRPLPLSNGGPSRRGTLLPTGVGSFTSNSRNRLPYKKIRTIPWEVDRRISVATFRPVRPSYALLQARKLFDSTECRRR